MAWIVTTVSSDGHVWYLSANAPGKPNRAVADAESAKHYSTKGRALDALMRKRLGSDIDSAWHHAEVIEHNRPGPALLSDLMNKPFREVAARDAAKNKRQ